MGDSSVRHELFHAVQDWQSGLFAQTEGPWIGRLVQASAAEVEAHLLGGPLAATFYGSIAVGAPTVGISALADAIDEGE